MSDTSQLEVSSAILAAAVIAKCDLSGQDLVAYAVNLQRQYIRMMQMHRKEDADKSS